MNENKDLINKLIVKIHKNINFMYYSLNKSNIDDLVHINLSKILFNSNKDLLMLHEILYNENDNKTKQFLSKKVFLIEKELKNIEIFNSMIVNLKKKKKMETLTLINTIFLPLGLIVGYFGMNFKSMGVPSDINGILTVKHGQQLVLIIFLIVTFISMFLMIRTSTVYL